MQDRLAFLPSISCSARVLSNLRGVVLWCSMTLAPGFVSSFSETIFCKARPRVETGTVNLTSSPAMCNTCQWATRTGDWCASVTWPCSHVPVLYGKNNDQLINHQIWVWLSDPYPPEGQSFLQVLLNKDHSPCHLVHSMRSPWHHGQRLFFWLSWKAMPRMDRKALPSCKSWKTYESNWERKFPSWWIIDPSRLK